MCKQTLAYRSKRASERARERAGERGWGEEREEWEGVMRAEWEEGEERENKLGHVFKSTTAREKPR